MVSTDNLIYERKLTKPTIEGWHEQARHLAKHICKNKKENKVCQKAYAISAWQRKHRHHLKYAGNQSKPCLKGVKKCPFPAS